MFRTTLILVLVVGILSAPLLCGAVGMIHGCICDSAECCPEEATCEADPCDDVYKEGRQKHDPVSGQAAASLPAGFAVSSVTEGSTASLQHRPGNKPFPDSDLPLRI